MAEFMNVEDGDAAVSLRDLLARHACERSSQAIVKFRPVDDIVTALKSYAEEEELQCDVELTSDAVEEALLNLYDDQKSHGA